MKKLSIAAGAAAIALVATTIFPVAGVFAKTSTYAGNDSVIDLKREVTDVTNPVTNTFSYTITQGEIPTGATVTGFPANAQIQFNNVTPTSGTATATTSLDFANTDYSKVGDYYFILKETDSTDPTNYPVDTASNDYKIIAQVRYVVDDQNIPDNNTFTTTLILLDANGDKVNTGIATWTSSSAYTYIEATAKTTGNMADKEKCFEYVIDIPATGAVTTGSKFTIDTASTCTGSDDEVTAGTPAKVYLKHGDTVTVGVNNGKNQLPIGAGYTITNNAHENYTSKIDGTEQDSVTKTTVAVDDSNFNTQNKTSIENNYDSNPITGIVTNFWFYLVLLMIGAFGVFFIIARRRDDDEEEA